MRVYAIGDIHGQLEKLQSLHTVIAEDQAQHGPGGVIVHLGDLVDRGPDSAGVIDYLFSGIADGKPWIVIKGNHDRLMTNFLEDPHRPDPRLKPSEIWLSPGVGGLATMESYGVVPQKGEDLESVQARFVEAVPSHHHEFLSTRPLMHRVGNHAYVHAGVRPGIALEEQVEDDLVWIRQEFLHDPTDHGAIIVHGHTPVEGVSDHGNHINVDTGAGYGRPLSAIVVENDAALEVTASGRKPIAKVRNQFF